MGILEMVLSALGEDASSPQILRSISEAENCIKEYCGLDAVPVAAYGLWCDMAVSLKKDNDDVTAGGKTRLTSLTMGDVSYGMADAPETAAAEIVFDFRYRLNRLRKGLFL